MLIKLFIIQGTEQKFWICSVKSSVHLCYICMPLRVPIVLINIFVTLIAITSIFGRRPGYSLIWIFMLTANKLMPNIILSKQSGLTYQGRSIRPLYKADGYVISLYTESIVGQHTASMYFVYLHYGSIGARLYPVSRCI